MRKSLSFSFFRAGFALCYGLLFSLFPSSTCQAEQRASIVSAYKAEKFLAQVQEAVHFERKAGFRFSIPLPDELSNRDIAVTFERNGVDLVGAKKIFVDFVESDPILTNWSSPKWARRVFLKGVHEKTGRNIFYAVTPKGELLVHHVKKGKGIRLNREAENLKQAGLNLGEPFYKVLSSINVSRLPLFSDEAKAIAATLRLPERLPFEVALDAAQKALHIKVVESVLGNDPYILSIGITNSKLHPGKAVKDLIGVAFSLPPVDALRVEAKPSITPSPVQTSTPVVTPTAKPTEAPTTKPTEMPSAVPSTTAPQPTSTPVASPTSTPISVPISTPTPTPQAPTPTSTPGGGATPKPTPSALPPATPTTKPSIVPTPTPTHTPSLAPTAEPTPVVPGTGKVLKVATDGTGDFSSVEQCAAVAKAGETCLVYPGSYEGTVTLANSGNAQGVITLKAAFPYNKNSTANRSVIKGNVNTKNFALVEGFEVSDGSIQINGSNVHVIGNYIHGSDTYAPYGAVTIVRTGRTLPYHANIVVKNNRIYQIKNGFSLTCSDNCLIENNEVERLFTPEACRLGESGCGSDADYSRMHGNGITFRGNRLFGSKLNEIYEHAHVDGIQTFTNGKLGGQGKDTLTNTIIENNYITDAHQMIWFTAGNESFDGVPMMTSNITIRNNLFLHTTGWGSARMAIGGTHADNIFVYNNTFGQSVRITAKTKAIMKNNIFLGNVMNNSADRFSWPQAQYEFSNNILGTDGWLNKSTGTQFPVLTQTNKFGLTREDLFVDPANKDYRLKPGSVGIDFGADLSSTGFNTDHAGGKRPQGAGWDVGAFEAGALSSSPLPTPQPTTQPTATPQATPTPTSAPGTPIPPPATPTPTIAPTTPTPAPTLNKPAPTPTPVPTKVPELPTEVANKCSSISQYGITWVFDKTYDCGTFANGDYWVVGPVKIMKMTPDYDGKHHGFEINPNASTAHSQSYDIRGKGFSATHVPALPYTAPVNTSIVKAISFTDEESFQKCYPTSFQPKCLETIAILTVLPNIPPGAGKRILRPPYPGPEKPLFSLDALDMKVFSRFDLPVGTTLPTLASVTAKLRRPQIDHKPNGVLNEHTQPSLNLPTYSPSQFVDYGNAFGRLFFKDITDADKQDLLAVVLQAGSDRFYAAKHGAQTWPGGSGITPAKKFMIGVFVALLGNAEMQKAFTEMTFFDENKVVSLGKNNIGLYGSEKTEHDYWLDILGRSASNTSHGDPYGYTDGGGKINDDADNYQSCCRAHPWLGGLVAMKLIPGLETIWSKKEAFESYLRRYFASGLHYQPDPCAPAEGICVGGTNNDKKCTSANMGTACPGGSCDFAKAKAATYKVTYGPAGNGQCILDKDPSDGIGRFPQLHGKKHPLYYSSASMNVIWSKFQDELFQGQ